MQIFLGIIMACLAFLLPDNAGGDIGVPRIECIYYQPYTDTKEIDVKFTTLISHNPFSTNDYININLSIPGAASYTCMLYKIKEGAQDLLASKSGTYEKFGPYDIKIFTVDLENIDKSHKETYKLSGTMTYYRYEKIKNEEEKKLNFLTSAIISNSNTTTVGDPSYVYTLKNKNGEIVNFNFEFKINTKVIQNQPLDVYSVTIMCNNKQYHIINTGDDSPVWGEVFTQSMPNDVEIGK